jgi:hemerythrin
MNWESEWTASYSVGVASLDFQHKEIFRILQDLYNIDGSASREILDDVLTRLTAYAQGHFEEEELLMAQAGYPGLAAHRAEHTAYIAAVAGFCAELEDGGESVLLELKHYLRQWWLVHILHLDMQYKQALSQASSSALPPSGTRPPSVPWSPCSRACTPWRPSSARSG